MLALADRSQEELPLPATGRLVDVLFDELPLQPQEHLQLPVSPHPKIRLMSETMANEPAAADAGAVGQPLCHERAQSGATGGERDRLKLSPLATPAPADCRIAVLIGGKSVQQAAQALGYDSTTAFITMFKKGLGQTPARYIASLTTTSR